MEQKSKTPGPSWPPQDIAFPLCGRPSGRGFAQGQAWAALCGSDQRSGRSRKAWIKTLRSSCRARAGAYVTEHWAKARYSRSTSRPRFSSLRNSCTHLQDTGLCKSQPGRRSCPEQAHRTDKGPWGALSPGRHQTAHLRPSDAQGCSGLRKDPATPQEVGRAWIGEEAGELSWTSTLEVAPRHSLCWPSGTGRGLSKGSPRGCLEAELFPALRREI